MTPQEREVMQMALDCIVSNQVPAAAEVKEALRAALAQPEQEPVGNTLTFMTRAIFNIVADHQEINGGYFITDGDVAAFVDRLAKIINSTFEPLKHKNTAPPQREWQGLTDDEQMQVAWSCGAMSADWLDFARAIEAKLREKNTLKEKNDDKR